MSIVLSISCITYNHAPYIRACLDGFLMQKTNFPFEILIHDDCSIDGTREIIEEYSQKYPDVIFPMFQTENQYSKGIRSMMIRFNFPRCRGKYIAVCEGDDYWTDPYKLQKQVDFLEINPKYHFSMGKVKFLNQNDGKIIERQERVDPTKNESYVLKDYLKGLFSQTSSFVFRNLNKSYPSWVYNVHAGDQTFVVLFTGLKGKIKYHNEFFSVYRGHKNSVSKIKLDYNVYERFLETLDHWNLYLDKEYNFLFKVLKLKYCLEIKLQKAKSGYLKKMYKIIIDKIQIVIELF